MQSNHLPKIEQLHQQARKAKSGEAVNADELGELLFKTLFDQKLRSDFLTFYKDAQSDNELIRVELEVDESQLPNIISLPWEFLYKPADNDCGIIRFASDPKIIFSRWYAQGNTPKPIQLKADEDLRIVLAVAAPSDLGTVRYEEVRNTIRKLAQTERIELSEFVNPATPNSINNALKKKPHIFHFIGHSELVDGGKIALVDDFGNADWINAANFGTLLKVNQSGVVLLQSCESGALSASDAYTGIASRVVQQQIPAVIAMQYEVSNATACNFASEFYRCLSKGSPVDLAAQEARRHIDPQASGKTRDFATPVIFMQVQKGEVFQREIPKMREIPDLIKQARKKEQESDYKQAIKIWRILEHIKIKNPDPDKQIKRLKDCIMLEQIKSAISKQGGDLPFLNQINDYIEQVKKEGAIENENDFIKDLKKFVLKKLSKDEFKTKCTAKFVSGYYQVQSDLPSYENMAKRLKSGQIIPILGTEALQLSQIAQKMATKIKYGNSAGTLSMISQYYQFIEGRDELLVDFNNLIEAEQKNFAGELNTIYNLLQKIEKPFILISSSYDSLWECIFQNNGKKYAVLSPSNQEVGEILLKYNDKPEELKTPENISGLLENGYSLIYKICGGCGLDSGDDNTLMISETDFFAVSKCLERLIPDYLIKQAGKKSFLFLGYDLEQWHDRLIAHTILEKARLNRQRENRYFTVNKNPTPYQRAFWKFYGVAILPKVINCDYPNLMKTVSFSVIFYYTAISVFKIG